MPLVLQYSFSVKPLALFCIVKSRIRKYIVKYTQEINEAFTEPYKNDSSKTDCKNCFVSDKYSN